VKKDEVEAYYWASLAVTAGNADANIPCANSNSSCPPSSSPRPGAASPKPRKNKKNQFLHNWPIRKKLNIWLLLSGITASVYSRSSKSKSLRYIFGGPK